MRSMQEEQVSTEEPYVVQGKFVAARCTWRPYARYLTWRWKKQGYGTAYVPVGLCKALVGAIEYKHSVR